MSRGDPWGCHEDWLNEQIAEAMHATHEENHGAYPEKGCGWCEEEAQAEADAARAEAEEWEAQRAAEAIVLAKWTCPRCAELVVPGFYCLKCGWVPAREVGK